MITIMPSPRLILMLLAPSIMALSGLRAASTADVAAEEPAGAESLALEVGLTDGSLVVGKLPATTAPLRTEFARMDLSWRLVRTLEFSADRSVVNITFQNGDRLTGSLEISEVSLETLWGKVRIPIGQVAEISVAEGARVAGGTGSRKGLVLYFPFDRDEGDRVSDRSGMGNHGTVHGAKWVSLGAGGAYRFRGGRDAGDHIRVLHNASLASMEKTRQITISAWVKPGSLPPDFPVVIAKGGQRPNIRGGYELFLNACGDNDICFISGACDITTYHANGRWINGHLNEWVHIAFVLDASKPTAVCYVNGKPTDDLASSDHGRRPDWTALTLDANNDLHIGAPDPQSHPNRAWFDGLMDEIRIHNRALSPEEIERSCRDEASQHAVAL